MYNVNINRDEILTPETYHHGKPGKDVNWNRYINDYILIQDYNNRYIFGKLISYNRRTNSLTIDALNNGKFKRIEQRESDIIKAWTVDKWSNIIDEYKQINVSGRWNSNRGRMDLSQNGSYVTGTYGRNGRLEGRMDGNTLIGTWSEPPTFNPPRNSGKMRLNFTKNSFDGRWGYGENKPDKPWNGNRVR